MKNPNHCKPTPPVANSGGNSPPPPKPPKTVEPEYTPLSGGHGGTVPPKVETPGN